MRERSTINWFRSLELPLVGLALERRKGPIEVPQLAVGATPQSLCEPRPSCFFPLLSHFLGRFDLRSTSVARDGEARPDVVHHTAALGGLRVGRRGVRLVAREAGARGGLLVRAVGAIAHHGGAAHRPDGVLVQPLPSREEKGGELYSGFYLGITTD